MNITCINPANSQSSQNISYKGSMSILKRLNIFGKHVEKDEFVNSDLYDALSKKAKYELNMLFTSLQTMIGSSEYATKYALSVLKKEKASKEREFMEEVLNFIQKNEEKFYGVATVCGYEVEEEGKFVLQTCIKLLYQLKDKEKIPSLKQDIEKARKLLEEIKNS